MNSRKHAAHPTVSCFGGTKQPTNSGAAEINAGVEPLAPRMAWVAHAAGFRSNLGNGIIAGFKRPFLLLLFFWPFGKEK